VGAARRWRCGVHRDIAAAIAEQHPPQAIEQAVNNGRALDYSRRKDGFHRRTFKLQGYIVNTLNTARREGHGVRPSRILKDLIAKKAAPAPVPRTEPKAWHEPGAEERAATARKVESMRRQLLAAEAIERVA